MALGWLSTVVMSVAATLVPGSDRTPTAPVGATTAPEWTQIQFNNATARDTPARWARDICIGAAGLSAQQSQFVVDRLSQRARALGLTPGRPGCDANVIVIFTNNPNQVAAEVLSSRDTSGRGRGRTAELQRRDEFANSRRAIRWWYVWQSVGRDGQVVNADDRAGAPASVRAPESGRLGRNTRQELANVFVVVDGTQIGQVNMDALADYTAMVALAQIDYHVDTGGNASILRLFNDSQPPAALTDWDLAFLREYYRAPQ